MEYDDETVLTTYIWDHFHSLMTDFELQVGTAIIGRRKVAAMGNPTLTGKLAERWGRTDNSEINAALAGGVEAFRQKVAQRVLAEQLDEVFVNRCPKCQRIVRTPRARQCFWCGLDWHAPSDSA